jgi:hypothetical protein
VSANTLEALRSRRRGRPVAHSRLVDEVAIGAGVALAIPPVAAYLMLWRRRPPRLLARELRTLHAAR